MEIIDDKHLDEDFKPICPHCDNELDQVVRVRDVKGFLRANLGFCYACPICRKVLGFADYAS